MSVLLLDVTQIRSLEADVVGLEATHLSAFIHRLSGPPLHLTVTQIHSFVLVNYVG